MDGALSMAPFILLFEFYVAHKTFRDLENMENERE
jgi:hypothetical protein